MATAVAPTADVGLEVEPEGTAYDWSQLLANEEDFYYNSQPEANAKILKCLAQSRLSPTVVLADLLKKCATHVAKNDVMVLCTLDTAVRLNVAEQVVAGREGEIRACVLRAQAQRVRINGNAHALLKKRWGGWNVCERNQKCSARLATELAKLCRLGDSKEDAKAMLLAQITKRRTTKASGVSKVATLMTVDVQNAITDSKSRIHNKRKVQATKAMPDDLRKDSPQPGSPVVFKPVQLGEAEDLSDNHSVHSLPSNFGSTSSSRSFSPPARRHHSTAPSSPPVDSQSMTGDIEPISKRRKLANGLSQAQSSQRPNPISSTSIKSEDQDASELGEANMEFVTSEDEGTAPTRSAFDAVDTFTPFPGPLKERISKKPTPRVVLSPCKISPHARLIQDADKRPDPTKFNSSVGLRHRRIKLQKTIKAELDLDRDMSPEVMRHDGEPAMEDCDSHIILPSSPSAMSPELKADYLDDLPSPRGSNAKMSGAIGGHGGNNGDTSEPRKAINEDERNKDVDDSRNALPGGMNSGIDNDTKPGIGDNNASDGIQDSIDNDSDKGDGRDFISRRDSGIERDDGSDSLMGSGVNEGSFNGIDNFIDKFTHNAKQAPADEPIQANESVQAGAPAQVNEPGCQNKESASCSGPQIPSSDLQGARGSFRPGTWLSATAIQSVLDRCQFNGIRVFDPTFLSADIVPRLRRGVGEDSWWIVPLLLQKSHWTLITIDVLASTAYFWNSLPNPAYESEARQAIDKLLLCLNSQVPAASSEAISIEWEFNIVDCPAQTNSHDCGVYIIVIALHSILKISMPPSIDPDLWREVLYSLLDEDSTSNHRLEKLAEIDLKIPSVTRMADQTPQVVTAEEMVQEDMINSLAFKDSLYAAISLMRERLRNAQDRLTLSDKVLHVLRELRKRITDVYETSLVEIKTLEKTVRAHHNTLTAYDECDVRYQNAKLRDMIQSKLEEYQRKLNHCQIKLPELEKAKRGWERAVTTCEEERKDRLDRVGREKLLLRDLAKRLDTWKEKQLLLVKSIESLQEELRSS